MRRFKRIACFVFACCTLCAALLGMVSADLQNAYEKVLIENELKRTPVLSIPVESGSCRYRILLYCDALSGKIPQKTTREEKYLSIEKYKFSCWAGELELEIQRDKENTVYFLRSKLQDRATIILEADGSTGYVREISYGDTSLPQVETLRSAEYSPLSSLYIDSEDVHIKLGRADNIRDCGKSVFICRSMSRGYSITVQNGKIYAAKAFAGDEGFETVLYGALCSSDLVNWDVEYKGMKAVNFDASGEYHILSDGVYMEKPEDYMPHPYSEQRYIYKSPAAWLLRSASEEDSGAFFDIISASMLYSTADFIKQYGFMPTLPESQRLREAYGIGAVFYDTRFNADTASALIYAKNKFEDNDLDSALRMLMNVYKSLWEKFAFERGGWSFMPDYVSGDRTVASGACSLNHFLQSAEMLYRGGAALKNSQYKELALEIFGIIDASAESWIRENGDLFYEICADGTFRGDDYVSVTYNNLVSAINLFDEYSLKYEGIEKLLAIKENWLRNNGYESLIS